MTGKHQPEPTTFGDVLRQYQWLNLLNPRMWWFSFWTGLFGGIFLAVALKIPESIYVPASFVLMGLILIATGFTPARCPTCRGRISIGATTCRNGHALGES